MTLLGQDGGEADVVGGDGAPRVESERLLSTVEVGAAMSPPVTDQTIRNWHKRGVITPAGRDDRGRPLFRLNEVSDQKKRNLPATGLGGRRACAGRKRRGLERGGDSSTGNTGAARQGTIDDQLKKIEEEVAGRKAEIDEARRRYRVGEESPEQLELLSGVSEAAGGLCRADADTALTHMKAQQARIEVRKQLGELIDVEEQRAEWARCLAGFAATLRAFPAKAASELGQSLKLRPDQVLEAREHLAVMVETVMRDIVGMHAAGAAPLAVAS